MARPRLGESETKRLQMVITEDELAAIDQWRFANHIGSRSDAIRRLCQVGLRSHDRMADLLRDAEEAAMRCHDVFRLFSQLPEPAEGEDDTNEQLAIADEGMIGIMLAVMDAVENVNALQAELSAIASADKGKDGPNRADDERAARRATYSAIFDAMKDERERAETAFVKRFRMGKDR